MIGIFQVDLSDSNNINVILKNIVFTNGKSGDGGPIMVKSAKGGAVKTQDGTLIIQNF